MADQYDINTSSSTYGQDDMTGGGEQIASAVYLNEQLAAQTQVVLTKQNAVVLQPSTPPVNPSIGDMLIDTAIYPNIIYSWSGSQWNRATTINPDEVGSYSIAQVDDTISNVRIDLSKVSSNVDVVTQAINDGNSLASKITQTTTYQSDRDGAITQKLSDFKGQLQDETYINTNFPKMVTSSQLTQTANQISANFQSGGGVNLLRDSVGWGGLVKYWQVTSGSASQYIGDDCIEAGSGISITDGTIKQVITATAGQFYTITCKVKKGTAGTAYVKLSDGNVFQRVDFVSGTLYNYKTIQISGFAPASGTLIVELNGTGATGGAVFNAIMVNIGTIGLQWSSANGEMYNNSVQFDINGVKVLSNQYNGYTVMSPSEFSGYYNGTKVFTLNKDVTEVAKLKITDPNATLEMGSIKVLYINGGGSRGWAFTANS
jgi:hypothetical protein